MAIETTTEAPESRSSMSPARRSIIRLVQDIASLSAFQAVGDAAGTRMKSTTTRRCRVRGLLARLIIHSLPNKLEVITGTRLQP